MTKTTITIVKTLLTAMLRLREWLFIIHRNFFKLLTFTYAGAYRHHTRLPIEAIAENQDYGQNKNETIVSLVQFRRLKTEELRFVQGGATLSGAAAIGVFSWPTTEKALWATKMLWNWGLFFSLFALISSAHQRLLRHLPEKFDQEFDDQQFEVALSLFLKPVVGQQRSARECPIMLMSYSWVFFVNGYALHLLSPVFDTSGAETSEEVSILTLCGCGLVVLNFTFCGKLCRHRLAVARLKPTTTASADAQV
ncbi:unnamed protein product [Fusarium graminearum]|uniref:Chromosome 2, complete genome n=1 Tax=Gibberella zeae (strain ATCC MYA-4620 / CBS 123657 / FGSC 9075 / NRRL 31084 / PH-1) TaxID=229533 RepID=I1RVF9_GIBZE|nr:hypothetical protein FGSG_08233 [Fusarium graminearum PH-1]ESU15149.1 hypothetical protein FGSG_08233 [Fusarium graminearum PH-1]CEF76517.1 unnamed protein product [Fusarium graminearum]CZS79810.1 unnamed protein product [Fusarium graminearum]|eukprot:XP_011320574.1 hypothetical protein FGSG_08233 [Fusarium graminearum PH-1]